MSGLARSTFDDLHLVADDGRAFAVFSAAPERRAAMADAVSWLVTRRFQEGEGATADAVVGLRAAGALADRLDEHRGVEGLAHVRVNSDDVRLLIEAASVYVAERDTESYQSPEERARIAELRGLVDPLFDLADELDRADDVLRASSI
jgi:hypothetical protein